MRIVVSSPFGECDRRKAGELWGCASLSNLLARTLSVSAISLSPSSRLFSSAKRPFGRFNRLETLRLIVQSFLGSLSRVSLHSLYSSMFYFGNLLPVRSTILN